MAITKLNVSLDAEVAGWLRQRAADEGKTMSRYLSDLIRVDVRRCVEERAAEGYRALGDHGIEFAEASLPLAEETWPTARKPKSANREAPTSNRRRKVKNHAADAAAR